MANFEMGMVANGGADGLGGVPQGAARNRLGKCPRCSQSMHMRASKVVCINCGMPKMVTGARKQPVLTEEQIVATATAASPGKPGKGHSIGLRRPKTPAAEEPPVAEKVEEKNPEEKKPVKEGKV